MLVTTIYSEAFARGERIGCEDGERKRTSGEAYQPAEEWGYSVATFLAQPNAKPSEQVDWTAGYRHGYRSACKELVEAVCGRVVVLDMVRRASAKLDAKREPTPVEIMTRAVEETNDWELYIPTPKEKT